MKKNNRQRKEKNIRKKTKRSNLKDTKGITLVALVVTIIVLLILAGVSLSAVFSEKGIFIKAESAGERYNEAKARETLETVLSGVAQYEKHSNPKGYNQNEILNKLITDEIPGAEIRGDVAIIGGKYAYELDRSVPKIGRYLGDQKDLIFPEIDAIVQLATDKKNATITINALEEKNGINKIEIWLLGEKIDEFPYDNVKTKITLPYTATQNGKYTIKVYGDLMASKTVEADGILASVKFEPNGNEEWKKEHSTIVTIDETVNKIVKAKYVWTNSVTTPEDNQFPEEQTFNSGDIITGGNKTMTGTYYLWTMIETQLGSIAKRRSEAFNFDNEGPVAEITPEPISETTFKLKAQARDDYNGIAKYEFYVEGNLIDTQDVTLEQTEIIYDATTMSDEKLCSLRVYDGLGNFNEVSTRASTCLHTWELYEFSNTTKYVKGEWVLKGSSSKDIKSPYWGWTGDEGMLYVHADTGQYDNSSGTYDSSGYNGYGIFYIWYTSAGRNPIFDYKREYSLQICK